MPEVWKGFSEEMGGNALLTCPARILLWFYWYQVARRRLSSETVNILDWLADEWCARRDSNPQPPDP